MQCPQCQHENPAGAKFCNACGRLVPQLCPLCSQGNPPEANFCNQCGASLTDEIVPPPPLEATSATEPLPADAERRHVTVLFCDLEGSTPLSQQLDPEDLREVIRAYQQTCAEVVLHFDGHVAQLLGDALLVYFGWPQAHEDDALRAVRTSLGMLAAMQTLNARMQQDRGLRLAIRIGMHTGLVVVGGMESGGRHEQLALGDTPNVASRIQGLAAPNTILISEATYRLIEGYVAVEPLPPQTLRGVTEPLQLYRVLGESGVTSRIDVAARRGLTPHIGREFEVALLLERWRLAAQGKGQVVLLSGESGIGKSRLVRVLKDHLTGTPHARLECRCSPYYENTALYPVTEMCQRVLRWRAHDMPEEKMRKLETVLSRFSLPLHETMPLLAGLLGLSLPADRYLPLTLTPQRQRQKTLEAFVVLLLEQITLEPVLFIVEDLHWSDPSTLELLSLLIDRTPTTRLLILLTCRPEFQPSWGNLAHVTKVTLNRLPRPQVQQLITRLTDGKTLPPNVLQQIVTKSDGVPLFVEEITKATLEADFLRELQHHYELLRDLPSLSIPATLQDILMARLDRLPTAKGVVQLGATIGREFSYTLLKLLSPLSEVRLRRELERLVEADLLYQRDLPPYSTYTFKHALIQEAAYQSLLRSTRQRHHRKIAEVLEAQFADIAETRPELVAHHYTEAGLLEQAIVYWRRAGRRAVGRSAYAEGIAHLSKGLDLLHSLPETPERRQQELGLLTMLGPALMTVKGYGAAEVEQVYARARVLCQQMSDTPRLLPVLLGLGTFHMVRAEYHTAQEVGEQVLRLAQQEYDPGRLLQARLALATALLMCGEPATALDHLLKGIAFDDAQSVPTRSAPGVSDPRVACRAFASLALWHLGYPDQARQRSHEALQQAEALQHPISIAAALAWMATTSHCLREVPNVAEQAEAAMTLATEQGALSFAALATVLHGWALAMQGDVDRGIPQLYQGLDAYQAAGGQVGWSLLLALLAEVWGASHKPEEGLRVLEQAFTHVKQTGERWWEAELYRRKGELLLALSTATSTAAEACLRQALESARRQGAKSWELRAAMSLSRLWHQQHKPTDAHQLLAEVYGKFTEGFDTADLQKAKRLLETLAG